uniref:MaoC-like domain-containing protein n=1 Tax=Globodera pallida TaxID=36090 RepID=A0A183BZU8_GLOPA
MLPPFSSTILKTDWPGIQFDLSRVLHGEQYIDLFAPFPPDGTQLRSEMRVADVLDKGANALIITEVATFDDRTDEKLSFQQFGIIQGGAGGFGGNRTSPAERKVPPVPQGRAPDAVLEDKTRLDQAALYRLGSGDLNPLHIDANFSKMAGFQRPILHGLCTLGISCRLILQAQTKVKETGKVVLSNGCVELCELSLNDGIVPTPTRAAAEQLKAAEVFRTIGAELQKNSDKLRNIEDAVILYEITTGGQVAGKYTVELKAGEGHVYEGMPRVGQNAVATVRVDDADFVKLIGGQLDATRMIGDDVDVADDDIDDDAESEESDDDETEQKRRGSNFSFTIHLEIQS